MRSPALVSLIIVLPIVVSSAPILPITSYTTDDGLASSQVWDIHQDQRGYLWFATSAGLCRYDGTRFTTFSAREGLEKQSIRTILETDAGDLWLGTTGGMVHFDGRRFHAIDDRAGASDGVVWAGARAADGRLWFGNDSGGVTSLGIDPMTHHDDVVAPDLGAYSMHTDQGGGLWIGHRTSGFTHCLSTANGTPSSCSTEVSFDGQPLPAIRAIAEDSDGNIYLGSRGSGLLRWTGRELLGFPPGHPLAGEDIYSLAINYRGELVSGTFRHGIVICDLPAAADCRSISTANGLPVDTVLSLLEDREGNLWIGSNRGVAKLATETMWSYTIESGLPAGGVYSIHTGPGATFLGTFAGLMKIEGPGKGSPEFVDLSAAEGLGSEVWSIEDDHRGRLWIGTSAGLCLYSNGRCELVKSSHGLTSDYILDIVETRTGNVWVGTTGGANLLRFDDRGSIADIRSVTVSDGLAGRQAPCVAEDEGGRIWFGSAGQGLTVLDQDRFSKLDSTSGLPSDTVAALLAAKDGGVWVGGPEGLCLVDLQTSPGSGFEVQLFGPETGIDGAVVALASGPSNLWVGTARGVLEVDPSALLEQRPAVLRRIDRDHGLISNELTTNNALALASDGQLWIGTVAGATVVDSASTGLDPDPLVVIDSMTLRDGRILAADFSFLAMDHNNITLEPTGLVLPPEANGIRVDARALWYRAEGAVFYQFQLEGYDAAWTEPSSQRFKEYTNLDPGHYRLRVRAGKQIHHSSAPSEILFSVQPSFWQTTTFAISCVMFFGVVALAFERWRTARIRARNRHLARLVAEQTDDLKRYAEALEENATALDRAYQNVRNAERSKSLLFASVSHELRTPLNIIIGFSDLLSSELVGQIPADYIRYQQMVLTSGKELLAMIDNLLDLAKAESGKMPLVSEEIDLGRTLDTVCSMMMGYARRRRVSIVDEGLPTTTKVIVDGVKLRQILLNLLSNAVKFSPDGGLVTVQATVDRDGDRSDQTGTFTVSVTDQGEGIPEDQQEAIFDPYHQANDQRTNVPAGTGLGLAIVKKMVQLMAGEVHVQSAPGSGSTFSFTLPLVCRDAPDSAQGIGQEGPSPQRPRVLIIEPRRDFSALAQAMPEGILAVRARDLSEATRMAAKIRPAVIVADIAQESEVGKVLQPLADHRALGRLPILLLLLEQRRPTLAIGLTAILAGTGDVQLKPEVVDRLEDLAEGHWLLIRGTREPAGAPSDPPNLTVVTIASATEALSAVSAVELSGVLVDLADLVAVASVAVLQNGPRPAAVAVAGWRDDLRGHDAMSGLTALAGQTWPANLEVDVAAMIRRLRSADKDLDR